MKPRLASEAPVCAVSRTLCVVNLTLETELKPCPCTLTRAKLDATHGSLIYSWKTTGFTHRPTAASKPVGGQSTLLANNWLCGILSCQQLERLPKCLLLLDAQKSL
jgi:hypothetical protein